MPLANQSRARTFGRLVLAYGPDWIVSIGLAGLFFWLGNIKGFRRHFSLEDTSIQFPYAVHERIPDWALFVISLGAPLVLLPIISVASERKLKLFDVHSAWLGLVVALAMAGSVTNIVKVTVGRPRPDLIDRCQPVPGSTDAAVFGLSSDVICTQTDMSILIDGWRSFPSGHSSLSFAGLGFLTFYVAGKLNLWDRRGSAVKGWVSLAPLMGAALVAISRTMDNRHHWEDVLGGSILGIVMAYFAYRQYFPTLHDPATGRPHPPLLDPNGVGNGLGDDDRITDEEAGMGSRP